MKYFLIASLIAMAICYPVPDGNPHVFDFQGTQFTLDGQPFRFVACELHYPRIPKAYWEHRLLMSKALGCNVVSAYVFWNYHEETEGVIDFETEERNLGQFIRLAQQLDMWVFIRPGPYVCAEWDAGGHPWWLLKDDIELRTVDPRYVGHVRNYIAALAQVLEPLQVQKGGNILMLQIENEFGYLNWDRNWVDLLKQMWDESSIQLKYYQAEPHTGVKGTHIPGVAIGINPGIQESYFEEARQVDANIPLFSSETWLGWFTHWGDSKWGHLDVYESVNQVKFLISHGYSFSIYMAHGGTSFGFWAGANYDGGYQPDISSYDYDSAINEAGEATARYQRLREVIKPFAQWDVPEIPEHVPFIRIAEFTPQPYAGLTSAIKQEVFTKGSPLTFEQIDQPFGLVSYTTVTGPIEKGTIFEATIHDYAQVYVNEHFIGTIDRRLGQVSIVIDDAYTASSNVLTVLVEAMGRINFGQYIFDQKGIIGKAYLNKNELNGWTLTQIPLDDVLDLQPRAEISPFIGGFFRTQFPVYEIGDTYLDLSAWNKGYVWVNGHNLGRFWNVGPQYRLYLPGAFLRLGFNDIVVLDLNQQKSQPIEGVRTLR